ncbi:hypothetical protein K492DRAFT_202261, partial [Lichtheimia hyalospora FSU 10163]
MSCKECTYDPNLVHMVPAVTSDAVVTWGVSSSAAVGADVVVACGVSGVSDVLVASGVSSPAAVARGVCSSAPVGPDGVAVSDAGVAPSFSAVSVAFDVADVSGAIARGVARSVTVSPGVAAYDDAASGVSDIADCSGDIAVPTAAAAIVPSDVLDVVPFAGVSPAVGFPVADDSNVHVDEEQDPNAGATVVSNVVDEDDMDELCRCFSRLDVYDPTDEDVHMTLLDRREFQLDPFEYMDIDDEMMSIVSSPLLLPLLPEPVVLDSQSEMDIEILSPPLPPSPTPIPMEEDPTYIPYATIITTQAAHTTTINAS